MSRKQRVSYFYHGDLGHYYYGPSHPMKPHRLKLAHHLILAYGLYRKMDVYRPHLASAQEMLQFHSESYLAFLQRVSPESSRQLAAQMQRFNMGEYTDCPIFDGIFEYCQLYTGCSLDGAVKLNHGLCDVAVNWSGGLHHAKKSEASGFCYVNDIVLAILELLKYHPRVLYIDIDIHHGDGVEEAFYCTNRVMTCSFHKYGDFFPGTGDIKDVGARQGKGYSLNFPLRDGMDDRTYERVFKPVMAKVMEVYRPTAVVLQCGTDSLTGDRLGSFNLTLKGHAECVRFVQGYGLPLLVLGGGGYTIRNVSRCWAYETGALLGEELDDQIPANDYYEYFAPDHRLHLQPAPMENMNTREALERHQAQLMELLRDLEGAPGVQMQEVPPDWLVKEDEAGGGGGGGDPEEADGGDPDRRPTVSKGKDGAIKKEHEAEFYDDSSKKG
mmetsp:Transcript_21455/g.33922  ORF Transcript_21455/g.33922 Transcript_21455/m.33922 type:complete len:441 (+) Transcript_21455:86-1408(+)